MEHYRIKETYIKNKNNISNKSNNEKESSLTYLKKENPKTNKNHNYLNINQKLQLDIGNNQKIEKTKKDASGIKKKNNYQINSTKINKSNLFIIKRNGAFRIIEITNSNKIKKNDNNKTEIENPSKTIRKVVSVYKNKLNNGYNDIINKKEKYIITEVNTINKINNFKYIKNNTHKLISIKKEKESLINNNCKQKLHFIKKHNQKNKEFDTFIKIDLIKNITNQKKLDKDKNELLRSKIIFKFSNKKDNNISSGYSRLNKKINHVPVKSLNYNNNHSELQKSLQKYFSLTPKNLKGKISSKEKNDDKKKNIFYNKIKLKENVAKNFYINEKQIKLINKNIKKGKDKITKFKKKSFQLTFNNSNLIKSSDLHWNYINKIGFENEKNILNINKNNYKENKNKHKKTITTEQNFINYKCSFLKHSSKSKSLNIVYNLDDYIGPNQYDNMIIPNHRRTVNQRLSSEKEKENKEFKKIFNTEGIKNSIEYYDKLKRRTNKTPDEYYNKKDLDKLVLSGEKNSQNYKIRNLLYNSVFNNNKLEFKKKSK